MSDDEIKSINFYYTKSHYFRVIHADGVWGGVNPSLKSIQMSFFSERSPIPQIIKQEITGDGSLGKELEKVSKDGILREIEANVVMDIDVAKTFAAWLQGKIQQAEELAQKTNREQDHE